MRRTLPLLILGLASLFVVFGCSGDPSTPAGTAADTRIQGEIGKADFEMIVSAASGSGGTLEGPFVLRGRNVQYVDTLSALVVDLTVRNNGRATHPEPVTLTFVDLIPSSVTVLNPDNGINGDGAAISFLFANADGKWTPGEESLPRTVQFGVASGVSIGFTGQLTVGQPADLGTIGGLVWNDAAQDSIVDEGEEGIAGVRIALSSFSAANAAFSKDDDDDDGDNDDDGDDDHDGSNHNRARIVRTGADGHYVFENVPAGAYIVTKLPMASGVNPTTPTQIYVLLTESGGVVADFLDANFGCMTTP